MGLSDSWKIVEDAVNFRMIAEEVKEGDREGLDLLEFLEENL